MKHPIKHEHLCSAATTVVAAALAIAWGAELLLGSPELPARIGLLCGSLTVCAVSAYLWMRRSAVVAAAVQRYIIQLCQAADTSIESVPVPTELASGQWSDALLQLQQFISSTNDRQMETEQANVRFKVRTRRLETEHQQMGEILSGMSDPVLAVNHYEELVLANDSARKLFEINDENTQERTLHQLVHCQRLIDLISEIRTRKSATQRLEEIEISDGSGEKLCYNATIRTVPLSSNAGGQPGEDHGAVVVLRDVSTHKAIQQRNAEFVSAVSHEMKTPLSGIKAYVELLADGDADDEETRDEFLTVINNQADRLQRLIDNMLNLARIEAGVVNVNKQSCSLNEILEEAFNVVVHTANVKNIHVQSDLSQMYLGVLADRDMILQVAINLLSNAIKYTEADGKITLRTRMKENDVQFEVEDTGVGLTPDDCDKVFDKFYRVKKDSQMAKGTGLGLPLAKHIVEDVHGGSLEVISTPGQGSTFVATLPAVGIHR